MFDIGFSELVLIALVALIVLGPERLPKVARTVGHLLGRMQRYASSVKADIEREIQLEELKKLETQIQAQARAFESEMQQQLAQVQSSVQDAKKTLDEAEMTALAGESEKTTAPPETTAHNAAPRTPPESDSSSNDRATETQASPTALEPPSVESAKTLLNNGLRR
ncbi:Sec-independent protein translocase protein TatB [Hydrogenophilus thiooxidans]|uniref:Sec-independent protein translocase protein TatB n=1 Tax=Hydrogenophilus thiooxidans TaxID=2820326 RepID=UPI001C22CA20|nr:Sec-independent protein translocase protein TatB [Hydrogenophilus thiooxidans]